MAADFPDKETFKGTRLADNGKVSAELEIFGEVCKYKLSTGIELIGANWYFNGTGLSVYID